MPGPGLDCDRVAHSVRTTEPTEKASIMSQNLSSFMTCILIFMEPSSCFAYLKDDVMNLLLRLCPKDSEIDHQHVVGIQQVGVVTLNVDNSGCLDGNEQRQDQLSGILCISR